MQDAPATQYFFSPDDTIYHFVQSEYATVCGRHVLGKPDQRRRREDFRIVNVKPEGFTALCRKCQGLAERELAPISLRHCRMSHPNYRDRLPEEFLNVVRSLHSPFQTISV